MSRSDTSHSPTTVAVSVSLLATLIRTGDPDSTGIGATQLGGGRWHVPPEAEVIARLSNSSLGLEDLFRER